MSLQQRITYYTNKLKRLNNKLSNLQANGASSRKQAIDVIFEIDRIEIILEELTEEIAKETIRRYDIYTLHNEGEDWQGRCFNGEEAKQAVLEIAKHNSENYTDLLNESVTEITGVIAIASNYYGEVVDDCFYYQSVTPKANIEFKTGKDTNKNIDVLIVMVNDTIDLILEVRQNKANAYSFYSYDLDPAFKPKSYARTYKSCKKKLSDRYQLDIDECGCLLHPELNKINRKNYYTAA